MIQNQKAIYTALLKAFIKICVAGVLIGLLHHLDWVLAILLIIKVVHSMYSLGFKDGQKLWTVPAGMCIAGMMGVAIEYWGTTNGCWEYHDIATQMPLWLPFAWMLSFSYIYKLEKQLFTALPNPSLKTKSIITLLIALILPAFGEVITIYLGVWTYYMPYQLLGVPLYALMALVIFHLLVNVIIYGIAHQFKIQDPVFNPKK